MEKKIDSTTLYEGKIITVNKDHVECPNKKIATREIVRHHGGVGILAIVNDQIILVKQYRYAYQQDLLEIPAGKLEKDENPYDAGKRELEEETGYNCKTMNLIDQIYPTPGYCDEVIHLYEANDIYKVDHPRDGDEDEFIDITMIPIDEAYQKVLKHEIKDSKTIIAIMYAYIHKHV